MITEASNVIIWHANITHEVIRGLQRTSQPASLPQKNFSLNDRNIALASGVGSIVSQFGSIIDIGVFPCEFNVVDVGKSGEIVM